MTLPFSSITFGDRFRKAYPDILTLAQSIETVGLIQPLTVDTTNRLLAGGRRFKALCYLVEHGRMSPDCAIPVHVRTDLNGTEDDEVLAREIELEENLQRNDMTWQENVLALKKLHELRARRSRQYGETWSNAMTGKLVGQSRCAVDQAIRVANAIEAGDTEVANAEHMTAALQVLLKRRLDEIERLRDARLKLQSAKAKFAVPPSTEPARGLNAVVQTGSVLDEDGQYLVEDGAVLAADLAAADRVARYDAACARVQHVACGIAHVLSMPANSLDGLYYDPPYGIDDSNLTMKHIDVTRAEHNRDANIALFRPFLEAVWHALRPASYAVFWCDIEHFTTHVNLATEIGFRVQRWPLDARKPLAGNGAAAYNTTKDVEHAVVIAKPGATLVTRRPTSAVLWRWVDGEAARYVHPFAKPFSAHEHILRTFWAPGARIHDMTCGEGSGVLAGLQLGYDMTGTDIVEEHVLRARRHIENLTA
jgi:hypothetical protein